MRFGGLPEIDEKKNATHPRLVEELTLPSPDPLHPGCFQQEPGQGPRAGETPRGTPHDPQNSKELVQR